MVGEVGIKFLTEEQRFGLPKRDGFNPKRLSWLKTPVKIRERGGALYGVTCCDRISFGHNGAASYCAPHGLGGVLRESVGQ